MTYEFMELTQQAATSHWGWTIAFFLWFVGLAGMGLFVNLWLKSAKLFYIAAASAVVGTLLVVSHLARMLNLPAAAFNALLEGSFNFGSWMFIGICILSVLCIVVVLQAWALRAGEKKGRACPWATSRGMAVFDAVLGVAATAYSGFLLTQAVGVPLWTTAVLPVLWICSGLASALGVVEMLAASGRLEGHPGWLKSTANISHIAEAFVVFAFAATAFSGSPGAVAGIESMLYGEVSALFWGGAVVLGIAAPMALSMVKDNKALVFAGGLCALLGALALRASVLFAGAFDPIIF